VEVFIEKKKLGFGGKGFNKKPRVGPAKDQTGTLEKSVLSLQRESCAWRTERRPLESKKVNEGEGNRDDQVCPGHPKKPPPQEKEGAPTFLHEGGFETRIGGDRAT